MRHALTIDLEDWGLAVLGPEWPVTGQVADNVRRLLDFLDAHGVRATFFALGRVCEAFPELLPEVAAAGHEIGSHGWAHELVYHQTMAEFEADVRRSVEVIEAQIGRRPSGFRAPAFSIVQRTLWAGPILARLGFRYDSSVFPIRKKRYGIADAPRRPYQWSDCALTEFPITTLHWAGRNWPICGGGYTRLMPAALMAAAIRRAERENQPAVIYLHPYEIVPGEVSWYRRQGFAVSYKRWLTQSLWRGRVTQRLSRLFKQFEWGPMGECLEQISVSEHLSLPEMPMLLIGMRR